MDIVINALNGLRGKTALLLTHHNADPDAISSAIALSNALKQINCKTRIGTVDSVSIISKNLVEHLNIDVEINPEITTDYLILLDTSSEGQLSGFAENVKKSTAKKIIIDHHPNDEKDVLEADFVYIDQNSTSSAEIVYSIIEKMQINVDKEAAFALLYGIVSETGHLRFATLDTFKLMVKLMEAYKITFQDIIALLNTPLDISERIARLKAMNRVKYEKISGYLVATSYVGSFEASSARALIKVGADLAVVTSKKNNEVRVSARSTLKFFNETKIDLGKDLIVEIAKVIEGTGSGHPTAAGANGKNIGQAGKALEIVYTHIKKRLEEQRCKH